MLLRLHVRHTQNALKNVGIEPDKIEEIIIGSTANDLCEITNEGQIFIPRFKIPHSILGSIAFIQSHFGNLASMHSMAKAINESPLTTKSEITAWFQFLNQVALGTVEIEPDKKVRDANVTISEMFSNHDIEYDQIFDSENEFKIKCRAIGMMCHLIQDLYTNSHCERNNHNEVVKFYCYQPQNKKKHKDGDQVMKGFEQELLNQCKNCIDSISSNKKYNFSQILLLSENVQSSDGGNFV
jgi:hypothetical protein